MATDEQGRLLTIARCTACGRGFVSVNHKAEMIDRYPRMDTPRAELSRSTPPCGGKIEMLPEPVLSDR